MNSRDFAFACLEQKRQMLELYRAPSKTAVATAIQHLKLDAEGEEAVLRVLDLALTDAFYSVLLALDGSASLGNDQQTYRLYAEDGQLLTGGDLEDHAYEAFYAV
jgi:hypothetical protein